MRPLKSREQTKLSHQSILSMQIKKTSHDEMHEHVNLKRSISRYTRMHIDDPNAHREANRLYNDSIEWGMQASQLAFCRTSLSRGNGRRLRWIFCASCEYRVLNDRVRKPSYAFGLITTYCRYEPESLLAARFATV